MEINLPLEELIKSHDDSLCSDPHDHVYSLLSLASDVTATNPFIIEYRCSLIDLMIETIAFCKSNNSLWLAKTQVDAFHLKRSFEGIADPNGWYALLLFFCREWMSKSSNRLSQLVTIEIERQQGPDDDGKVVRFTAQSRHMMFLWPVTFAVEVNEGRQTMAEVVDPHDALMIGRNSSAIQHLDFFHISRATQDKPFDCNVDCALLNISIGGLMYLVTVMTYFSMNQSSPSLFSREKNYHLDDLFLKALDPKDRSGGQVGAQENDELVQANASVSGGSQKGRM